MLLKDIKLTESTTLSEMLQRECSNMINSYKSTSTVLYRGVASTNAFINKQIRQDRKPVELDRDIHNLVNLTMKNMNIKARRDNSIFCSTSVETSFEWGKPYIIFVPNGWSGTVFKKCKDKYFYNSIVNFDGNENDMKNTLISEGIHQFDSTDLNKILNDKYKDILITGEKYYGLRVDNATTKSILEKLEIKLIS